MPLFSTRPGGLTLPEAYAAADTLRRRRLSRGERPLGWKIGFTNRSIWDRYGVHAPIWGPVWDSTVTQVDGTEHTTSLAGLVQPRLEPEVVFGFARVSPWPQPCDGQRTSWPGAYTTQVPRGGSCWT